MTSSLKRKRARDGISQNVSQLSVFAQLADCRQKRADESHELEVENVPSEDDMAHRSQENDSDNDIVMSDGTGDIAQDEWGGIQDGKSSGNAPDKSKKPPTGEEIRTIMDATELFRSNAFKLQVSNHRWIAPDAYISS